MTEAQKVKAREACRRWRARNPGAQAAATRSWALRNPEKAKASVMAYRQANPLKASEWAKEYRARNPEYSMRRYGTSLAQFISLAVAQKARCAICGQQTKLCIDHNHKTGKVRGLLCRKCNAAIGLFNDSASALQKATAYVREELTCSE